MTDLITEARELCEKATPGPWMNDFNVTTTAIDKKSKRTYGYGCDGTFICDLEDGDYHEYADENERYNNAAFIARSRTLIPELCDALEKAEAEAKALNDCNQKLAEQNRRLIWRNWIPVTEDIPPYGDEVLVMHSGVVDIAVMDEVNAFTGMFTHWQPLPSMEGLSNDT